MSERFRFIIIIIIIFLIFLCLDNIQFFDLFKKIQFIEGASEMAPDTISTDPNIQEETEGSNIQLPGSSSCLGQIGEGDCEQRINNRCQISGSFDEKSCTGISGWNLQWLKKGTGENTRNDLLNSITPIISSEIIDSEDEIRHGDVFSLNGNPSIGDIYLYKDSNTISGSQINKQVPLIPWYKRDENGGVINESEYCINIDTNDNENFGKIVDMNENECITSDENLWITPENYDLMKRQYEIKYPDVLKDEYCSRRDSTDINIRNTGGDCYRLEDLYIPHCVSEDGTEIQPVRWWNNVWISGKSIENICEGIPTGNAWDTGMFSDTVSAEITQYAQSTYIDTPQSDEAVEQARILEESIQQGVEQQAENCNENNENCGAIQVLEMLNQRSTERLVQSCNFEGTYNNHPTFQNENYFGNETSINGNTIGGYVFENKENALNASNVQELINNNLLSCNSPNFSRIDSGIRPSVYCGDEVFKYQGCKANICQIPEENDIFNIEYYKFKDGSEMKSVGDTFTLNDFIDPLTNEIKIECKDGYHIQTGSEINVSCSSSDGEYGIPEITGCVPNVCSIGDTVSKYSFIGLSGDDRISYNNFMDNNYSSESQKQNRYENCSSSEESNTFTNPNAQNYNGSCFKCNQPSYFSINDELSNNERDMNIVNYFNERNNQDTTIDFDIEYSPKVSCNENLESFNFQGCYQNKCYNPSVSNQIYHNSNNKPGSTIGSNQDTLPHNNIQPDTIQIKNMNDNNNHYSKFVYDNLSPETLLTNSDLSDKIRCGINYYNSNVNNIVPTEDIKCYNFFDIENRNDNEKKDVPFLNDINDNGLATDNQITHTNYTTSKWCEFDEQTNECLSFYKDDTFLNFSIDGCQPKLCSWPRSENNTPLQGYEIGELNNSTYNVWNTNSDEKLSAVNWANVNTDGTENDNSLRCKTSCDQLDPFTNEDINSLLNINENTSFENDERFKGQGSWLPNIENVSGSFQGVNRGGPFQIEKCFQQSDENAQPIVTCNENDGILEVTGCEQKQCRLDSMHALNGLRITIDEENTFKSIGGNIIEGGENSSTLFNVDQIKNITCDKNFKKINPDLPTTISCNYDNINNNTFTIENGCEPVSCIIPFNNAPDDSPGKIVYENLSDEDKEKWNNSSNLYNYPSIVQEGNLFQSSEFSDNICSNNSTTNQNINIECSENNIGYCTEDPTISNKEECGICSDEIYENETDCITNNHDWTKHNFISAFSNIIENQLCNEKQCLISEDITGYDINIDGETKNLNEYRNEINNELINISSLDNLSCSNTHTNINNNGNEESINITCNNGDNFEISGCYGKMCSLPEIDNFEMLQYTYTGNSKQDLQDIANTQNNLVSLSQFNNISSNPLSCSDWSRSSRWTCDLQGNEVIEPAILRNENDLSSRYPDRICYDEDHTENPPEGYGTGHYLPIEINPSAQCNNQGGDFDFEGCTPQVSNNNSFEGGQYYYEFFPGNCFGVWNGGRTFRSGTGDGTGNVLSITHDENNEQLPITTQDQNMKSFMDTCKRHCDNVDRCDGFTVTKLDSSTSDTRINPNNILINNGIMICEQKDNQNQCIKDTISSNNWSNYWGTDDVYRNVQIGTQNYSVFKHEAIPFNGSVYFEKKISENIEELR